MGILQNIQVISYWWAIKGILKLVLTYFFNSW
jgi:hypothetical protein